MTPAAQPVDLRSDFLTRPTEAMRDAMTAAALRPAQFGLREDPQQQLLEKRTAALLGMEDALLFPTCTMANEVALMLLSSPGEVVVAPPDAHVVTSEAGGPAALAGVRIVAVPGDSPCPPVVAWASLASGPGDASVPRVSALLLENTHNRSGGIPVSVADGRALVALARQNGMGAHLDGSRLFNAAVALGVSARDLCAGFDTVAISLNKGLGAPLGAMLCCARSRMPQALRLRQRLGGGIRPTGALCAAALLAIEDTTHLADDHRRAKALAVELAELPCVSIDPARVLTNLVVVDTAASGRTAIEACARLAEHGVLALPFGTDRVRLVLYRDIGDDDVVRTVAAFRVALA